MENFFATIFGEVSYARSLFFLLSLGDPDILKKLVLGSRNEYNKKTLAPRKLHRQRNPKECVALRLLDY